MTCSFRRYDDGDVDKNLKAKHVKALDAGSDSDGSARKKRRDRTDLKDLINDSPYGLTASIWTKDIDAAEKLGNEINTGTLFMNRCDYLDPGLSWTGVKETGRGCSLSEIAYEHLTKPKSFHLRKELK